MRDEVDAIYQKLIAVGHTSVQVPYDAFWDSRFAVVADPESNSVGLESPFDNAYRHWPPKPSPDQ